MSDANERILTQSVSEMGYRDFMSLLGRRKWAVLGWVVVGLAVAAGVSVVMPKVYVSEARLLVPGKTVTTPAGSDLISQIVSTPFDAYDVTTQIQILQSQDMLFQLYGAAGVSLPRTQDEADRKPKIDVIQLGDTNVISARISADNEATATTMAQQLPKIYADFVSNHTTEVVNSAVSFLNRRVKEETQTLDATRAQLADYQKQNNVSNSTLQMQVTAALYQSYDIAERDAEGAVDGAQAALARVQQDYENLPKTVMLPVTRSNVQEIEQAKVQLQVLQTQLQALSAQYFPQHPLVKAAQAQVDSQKAFIAGIKTEEKEYQEVRNPQLDQYQLRATEAKATLADAQQKLDAIREKKRAQEGRASQDADKLKGLSDLEKNITDHETTLAQLNQTLESIKLKTNQLKAPVQNMTQASLAQQTQPNWPVNLGVGAALGLFLGVLAAIMRDFSQDKVLSGSDAVRLADSHVLARIPRRLASAKPIMMTAGEALSFEAYRILRTNILSGAGGQSLKSIVVTASTKGEGASTVAGNLAVALAQEGKKTVLVEANMRDPIQERFFELSPNGGLNQALSQGGDAASLALDSGVPNLKVLVAGGTAANATEALAGPGFETVMTSLKGAFDYIIIDAPAAFTTADAHEVGRRTDGVLMVVESGKPSKSQLAESIDMMRHAGGKLLGMVMNKDKDAANRIA